TNSADVNKNDDAVFGGRVTSPSENTAEQITRTSLLGGKPPVEDQNTLSVLRTSRSGDASIIRQSRAEL
ncbi:unnamed protein product, partial [Amoebophrya sp. A25]